MVGPRPRIPRFSGREDTAGDAAASPRESGGSSSTPRSGRARGASRSGIPVTPSHGAAPRETGQAPGGRIGVGPDDAQHGGSGSSTVMAPVPAHSFNGRLVALIVVATIIVFLAAPTAKIYVDQRAQIAQLEQSIAQAQQQQQTLKRQEQRWSDDTYVEQQARERMFYVMPGESAYLVLGADGTADEPLDSSAQQVEAGKPAWADGLWRSVLGSAFPDRSALLVPGDAAGQDGGGLPAPQPSGSSPAATR